MKAEILHQVFGFFRGSLSMLSSPIQEPVIVIQKDGFMVAGFLLELQWSRRCQSSSCQRYNSPERGLRRCTKMCE